MSTKIQSADQARKLLDGIDGNRRKLMDVIRLYQSGDHWQMATGWGGPALPEDAITQDQAEQDQTPIPVIDEAIERYVTGMLGDEPSFEVVLNREVTDEAPMTPDEAEFMSEFNSTLGNWWDVRGGLEIVQDALENLCSSRGTLRPFIPPESPIVTDGKIVAGLAEAMEFIYLEAPDWNRCGVFTDVRSMRDIGIYLYQEQYINETGETEYKPRVEITELDENGNTVFQIIEGGTAQEPQVFDCDGNIWVFQAIDDNPMIREPQRKLQKAIDFLNTILPKNAVYAGYRERHAIGIKPNVELNEETGKEDIIPPILGPATFNFWQPTVVADDDGKMKPVGSTLIFAEPVDSEPIRNDIKHMIGVFLQSVHQDHIMISGDATASAVSRVQARAGFANSLLRNKPKVERMMRDMLMTVLCIACEISGETEKLTRLKSDYRLRVDVKPNSGPLSSEERMAVVTEFDKRIISLETAQTMLGVEDVEAEGQKLREAEETSLSYKLLQAQIMQATAMAGAHLEPAALYAGVDPTEAKALGQGDFVTGGNNGGNTDPNAAN